MFLSSSICYAGKTYITYTNVGDLPETHRFPHPVSQYEVLEGHWSSEYEVMKDVDLPRQAFVSTFMPKPERAAWDKLPASSFIVHSLEPLQANQVWHKYFDYPDVRGKERSDCKGEGVHALSRADLVRYYPHLLLGYKQVISGSLIQLDGNNPDLRVDDTYSSCGFVMEVPSICIASASFEDLFTPMDIHSGCCCNGHFMHYELYMDGPRCVHDKLQEYYNSNLLDVTPRQVLAYSYGCTPEGRYSWDPKWAVPDHVQPKYNEVCFLPEVNGQRVRIKGIYINWANKKDQYVGDYEISQRYRLLMKGLARELNLPVLNIRSGYHKIPTNGMVVPEEEVGFHCLGTGNDYYRVRRRYIYRNPAYLSESHSWRHSRYPPSDPPMPCSIQ